MHEPAKFAIRTTEPEQPVEPESDQAEREQVDVDIGRLNEAIKAQDAKAQPLAIEIEAGRRVGDVQAEVSEPPDLERLREHHATDVEPAIPFLCHDGYSL